MNTLGDEDAKLYETLGARMEELAREQPGFLGVDSVRADKEGITVSYWSDLDSIKNWKINSEHTMARNQRKLFYEHYETKISKVERQYGFESI